MMSGLLRKLSPWSHGKISVIWAAYVMMAFLIIYLARQFQRSPLRSSLEAWDWAIVAWVVYSIWAAYWFRRKWPTSTPKAGRAPINPEKRWELVQIVSYASATSIVLGGFFASVALSSPSWFSYLLYGVGVVLLLVFEPTDPPTAYLRRVGLRKEDRKR